MSRAPALPARRAMILCAGLGERLRPLSEELPKPLVPVGDRPVLAQIAAQLRRAGYESALANTHWLHEKFEAIVGSLELDLTLVYEPEIRGVAGGIAGARALLAAPALAWNGDILIDDPPLDELVARVRATSEICLAVAPTSGPGSVGLDAAGNVVRLRGERFGREVRAADYVGLLALGERALAELPEWGCLIGDYCLPRLRRGQAVETYPSLSAWREVGSVDAYLSANWHWLSQHANGPQGSYVHPTASVGPGVQLEGSVIGANARIDGAGLVEGCVLWPGSHAVAPLGRTVVTPRTRVRGSAPA
jgi:mannose-1-phosphate guanylyltransferase